MSAIDDIAAIENGGRNTAYFYRISAVNADGTSSPSSRDSIMRGEQVVLETAEAYWRANRYTGSGNWLDESGNGHHAVPLGTPTWDGDKFSGSVAGDWFTVPNAAGINFAALQDFTVVTVVASEAGARMVISKEGGLPTPVTGYGLQRTNAQTTWQSYTVQNNGFTSPGRAFGAGQVTLTLRRSGLAVACIASNDVTAGGTANEPPGGRDVTNTAVLGIGVRSNSSAPWVGDIYGAAVWRSALTDQQITDAGAELVEPIPVPSGNRMGGTGAIRRRGGHPR